MNIIIANIILIIIIIVLTIVARTMKAIASIRDWHSKIRAQVQEYLCKGERQTDPPPPPKPEKSDANPSPRKNGA